MCVFYRARLTQLDDVLATPSLSIQDHGGKLAHDIRAYYPEKLPWGSREQDKRVRIQAKHRLYADQIEKYSPRVVILPYTAEGGIDKGSIARADSLSEKLCVAVENDDIRRDMDCAYLNMRERINNWPDIRAQLLGGLAQTSEVELPHTTPES